MMSAPLSIRQAEQQLSAAGFVLTETNPHLKWQHPDGRYVTLPHGRKSKRLYGWLGQRVDQMTRDNNIIKEIVVNEISK